MKVVVEIPTSYEDPKSRGTSLGTVCGYVWHPDYNEVCAIVLSGRLIAVPLSAINVSHVESVAGTREVAD